ncbi:MAG: hypothetical protein ACLT2T_07615 [Bilophila wadsworthia]
MPSAQPLSSFAVPASGTSGAAAPSSGSAYGSSGDLHDKAARLGEIQGWKRPTASSSPAI